MSRVDVFIVAVTTEVVAIFGGLVVIDLAETEIVLVDANVVESAAVGTEEIKGGAY